MKEGQENIDDKKNEQDVEGAESNNVDGEDSKQVEGAESKQIDPESRKDANVQMERVQGTESKRDEGTESKQDEGAESKQDEGTESKQESKEEEGTESQQDEGSKTKQGKSNESKQDESTESKQESKEDEGTESQQDEGSKSKQGKSNESKQDEGNLQQDESTESKQDEGTESKQDEGTKSKKDEGTESKQNTGTVSQQDKGAESKQNEGTKSKQLEGAASKRVEEAKSGEIESPEAEHMTESKQITDKQDKGAESNLGEKAESKQVEALKSGQVEDTELEEHKNVESGKVEETASEQDKAAESKQDKSADSKQIEGTELENDKDTESRKLEKTESEQDKGADSTQDKVVESKQVEGTELEEDKDVESRKVEGTESEQAKGAESKQVDPAKSEKVEDTKSEQDGNAKLEQVEGTELGQVEGPESESKQLEDKIPEELNKNKKKSDTGVHFATRKKSIEEKKLPYIFRRPRNAALKHPIFSSPFAKHIASKAFGPLKPPWFKSLNTSRLSLFKNILKYVEIGREGPINFDGFLRALQKLDPTITKSEVMSILESMHATEFEELDFGRFLFLLAFGIDDVSFNTENIDDDYIALKKVTKRQCLILSAIASYVSIVSIPDIENYYAVNTRRGGSILSHHMENVRLKSLNEAQMERKQRELNRQMVPLRAITTSPYAHPVPVVKRFSKSKVYLDWANSKNSLPIIDWKSLSRKRKSLKKKGEAEEDENAKLKRLAFDAAARDIIYKMNYGRIPIPELRFPKSIIKQMRKGFTVELKDYIMQKAFDTLDEFRNNLRKSAVLYAKAGLVPILRQGFPTKEDRDHYIEVYRRYLPLQPKEVELVSLWTQPYGYEKDAITALDPEKYAFGTKLPIA